MSQICVKVVVTGRVQGVFYRSNTQKKAVSLGITGLAKNLSDGTVEVIACGEKENVDHLIKWLWQGPPQAKVTDVKSQEIEVQKYPNFRVE